MRASLRACIALGQSGQRTSGLASAFQSCLSPSAACCKIICRGINGITANVTTSPRLFVVVVLDQHRLILIFRNQSAHRDSDRSIDGDILLRLTPTTLQQRHRCADTRSRGRAFRARNRRQRADCQPRMRTRQSANISNRSRHLRAHRVHKKSPPRGEPRCHTSDIETQRWSIRANESFSANTSPAPASLHAARRDRSHPTVPDRARTP